MRILKEPEKIVTCKCCKSLLAFTDRELEGFAAFCKNHQYTIICPVCDCILDVTDTDNVKELIHK